MSNLVFDESSANSEASHGYAWWFSGDTFEKAAAEERTRRKRSFIHHLTSHPGRLTIIYFLLLVALSTSLLLLPVSSHEEEPTSFSTAFFTAVSALSTCGISIVNATTHWTAFGQVVLLVSVQMGGLGVMTFASLIALAANHHMKATQRLLTANELGTTKLNEIRGVLTVVITTTFIIESVTFLALFPGLYGINRGNVRHTAREALFFAVMSYNNAGFTPDGAGLHVNNWAVGMPIMASAFCGTLGFPVLLNLMRCARHRTPPRRWSLHTKITLVTTFSLVLLSLAWLNDAYLFVRKPSEMSDGQKYRLKIAKLIESGADVWVADEFGAVLDRVTAQVVASNLQRAARAVGATVIVATTHEDLKNALRPSVQITKHYKERVKVDYEH